MSKRLPVLFIAGDFLSLLGNSLMVIVLPWLVLARTGDVAAAGIVSAITAAPALVAAILGGWVIDRFGRRRITIIADVLSALSVVLLAVIDSVWGLDLGWFIVLGLLGALIDAPGMTAREALMPDVARVSGMPLGRLAGLREGLAGVAFIIGPPLAGVALTLFPAATVVLATAICSFAAAVATIALPRSIETHGTESTVSRGMLRDLVDGARTLWNSRVLFMLTVLSTGSAMVFGPVQGLLLPAHFTEIGAPGQLGLSMTALAVGSIAGSGIYAVIATRFTRRFFFVSALVLATIGLLGLAFLPSFWLLFAAMALAGVGSGLLAPLVPVLVAEEIPGQFRGRVLGLQNAALMAVAPLGMLGAGLLASSAGLGTAMWVIVAVWSLVTVAALVTPGLEALDIRSAGAAVPGLDEANTAEPVASPGVSHEAS